MSRHSGTHNRTDGGTPGNGARDTAALWRRPRDIIKTHRCMAVILSQSFPFPKRKKPNQTWEATVAQLEGWWKLPKQERAALITKARKMDIAESISRRMLEKQNSKPIEAPEETPFFVPDGMSPEEATAEKVKRDAERWPIVSRTHEKATQPPPQKQQSEDSQSVYEGPRGGKYRIDENGRKRYDVA